MGLFLSNEEMGKKNDDHKPTKRPPIRPPQWNTARVPPRKSFKRLAIAVVVGICVYLFIHNIPTDVGIQDRRRPVYHRPDPDDDLPVPEPIPMPRLKPAQPPAKPNKQVAKPTQDSAPESSYNGPVVFPHLAVSLQAIYSTRGAYTSNKNVLFAASSLKSAAALLPMACQMGVELRSFVHFALMSKSEISMDELRAVNGVDDSCEIIFHDARPSRSASSTESRLRNAVGRAMYHINSYMHPQAVLVDGSSTEQAYFLEAMRSQSPTLGFPVIELPSNSLKHLGWMAKLDSSSLAAWNKVSIDILIHAPPGASGSLIRLLRSLSAADLTTGATPHLTIELPHKLDLPTVQFLETFQWPPVHAHNPGNIRQLTLRHRIPRGSLTEEESSVRFLESFWPTDPRYSHVLVLSPQAEVSPQFFHYIKYAVLEYTRSSNALFQEWDSRLLGISLDLPSTHLDTSATPFEAPSSTTRERDAEKPSVAHHADTGSPFLWQSPNSNAVLYMGQKWVELHDLVSRSLDLEHSRNDVSSLSSFFSDKAVSKRYPSWLEYALKLSRARGYWTLYPSRRMASSLATVHSELYKAPEEYASSEELPKDTKAVTEIKLADGPLLESLHGGDGLVPVNDMPILLWDGKIADLEKLDEVAAEYAGEFRHAAGGCEKLSPDDLIPQGKSVRDLFCSKT
ncbi:hypothetical protein B0H66DRAFT_603121 [Apodospora peruviana]|uniref:Glycosyltransferase 2 n=1 Tax=Apodospora peruviana TaxID=516989 RepID=A0AAE0I583_9PEZI|nr:hypothetical protein B0H66DRAFT_603121 [Apodospora peruviana]